MLILAGEFEKWLGSDSKWPPIEYSRLLPSGQITNAVRLSLRSIFFGPNSLSVKAISKAITSAVRSPFRTTVTFLWQNGKFTLVIAVKWVFSINCYDHFGKTFFILKNCHLHVCFPHMYNAYITNMANNVIIIKWRLYQITHCYMENKMKCSTFKYTIDPLVI